MATVLLSWELGSGIGHLMNLRPIGAELIKRGHRVVAALRDLSHVHEVWHGLDISFLPSPLIPREEKPPFDPPTGFLHLLANIGFANQIQLATAFRSWNTIFDCVRPDLVVVDHSPTALLALRGRDIPRVNVGLGFFCPPPGFPLPFWSQSKTPVDRQRMARDEEVLTVQINALLKAHRRPELQHLSQAFTEISEIILATYAEFDHFSPRLNARYWGHWPFGPGIAPIWPAGSGPKVYAYLKPFPALEDLLSLLRELQLPTLIYAGGIDRSIRERFDSRTIRFEDRPLDLQQTAKQCDIAIANAGHGTTVGLLLAGKPCLSVPLYLEQILFGQKVEQMGGGLLASPRDSAKTTAALRELLANGRYRQSAQAFAAKYAHFVPGSQIPEIVDRMESHIH